MTKFYFIGLALCWGTAFLATKNIVDAVDPYWGAFSRVFFGFLFFIILFTARRKSVYVPVKKMWKPWFLSSLLIVIPFLLMFWGQRFVPSGLGGVFNGTVPIWAFIAGAILVKGDDAFSWTRAGGVALGLVGLLVIMLPRASFASADSAMFFWGCVALMLMAVCYALGNVFIKIIMVDHSEISTEGNIFQQYLFGVVCLGIYALIFGTFPDASKFTPKVIFSMLHVGVISSAVAFLFLYQLVKRIGPTRTSAVTYLVPIVALVLDFIATGRVPTVYEFAGVGLIFLSLFIIEKPVKKVS